MSDLADFYSFDWSVADYAAETRRLRHAIRDLLARLNDDPDYIYGDAIVNELETILNPDQP